MPDTENATPTLSHDSEAVGEKRPYMAPRLVHLGSVRELTLGGTGGSLDDTFTVKAKPGGLRKRR